MYRQYSAEKLKQCLAILADAVSLAEGIHRIQRNVDHRIDRTALSKAFRRHGLETPSSYVGVRDQKPLIDLQPQVPGEPGGFAFSDVGNGPLGGPTLVCNPGVSHGAQTGEFRQAAPEPPDPLEQHERKFRERELRSERKELLDRLRDAEDRNRFADRISSPPPAVPRITTKQTGGPLREATAVALASDWHIEESVYPDAVAGRNEYGIEIAKRRAERFFDGVEWLIGFNRGAFDIRSLVLWLGGDLITGYIHPELEEDNELSPIEATLTLRVMLRRGISQLLQDTKIERLVIPCNYGNHGRTTEKRRIKTAAQNSYEWLLYNVLRDDFADNPRVEFHVPRAAHCYVEAHGFTLHFHHGDELSYGGGIGGLAIPLGKRIPKWDSVKDADYHHIGHFHQFRDLGHTIVNGSLIGYSEYAMSIGAEFELPQQAFYVLDARRGKSIVAPIWVEASEADAAA